MPADSTFNEMVYKLNVTNCIERGMSDAEAGRTITHEELGQRLKRLQVTGIPITEPM